MAKQLFITNVLYQRKEHAFLFSDMLFKRIAQFIEMRFKVIV